MDYKGIIDTRRKNEMDVLMFLAIFILAGIGLVMCYSASAVYAERVFKNEFYFLQRQIIWFSAGIVIMMVFQTIDYRNYPRYTRPMLLAAVILLVLVLIPGIGHNVKGSARWINLGLFKVQPSEFVKIAIVIYLCKVFSSESKGNQVIQLVIPMCILAAMFVLIMLQPDFGTAVDLLIVSVIILFVSGFPLLYILSLFVISIPMFYLLVYQVSYRKERILAYLNPWEDRFGIGYHITQSFVAFKKGGFLGLGLGFGTQKVSRLPEPHNDFIYAVIAEEVGIFGTVLMVILYGFVFWRGIEIAMNAPDDFGRLLATGLTLMITVQAFLNIGVVTGSLPTTGIPLPFISYGGSSLISNMIAAGILLNISRYREAALRGFPARRE